jgi:hypothetical protein
MNLRISFLTVVMLISTVICSAHTQTDTLKAYITTTAPIIDGSDADACWTDATWYPIDVLWMGPSMTANDFTGRYKLSWDKDFLYLLVEVTDDSLSDQKPNPTTEYWTDDCIEIFFDEDRSGGDHWYNHNAFAYHVSIKYDVVDIDTDHSAKTFNNNVVVKIDTIEPHKYMWELAIKVYDDTYDISSPEISRRDLLANDVMGLTMAYCDNDGNNERDNFIGSINMQAVGAPNNDVNYQTADYFGSLLLIDPDFTDDIQSNNAELVDIYPNPASSFIVVKSNVYKNYRLITLNGQVVKSSGLNSSGESKINIEDIKKGIYIIELTENNNASVIRKIIIE